MFGENMSLKALLVPCISLSTLPVLASTPTNQTCRITFNSASDNVELSLLENCVTELAISDGSKLYVVGYASKDGPVRVNFALSSARARSVEAALKEKFTNLEIRREGLGVLDAESRYVLISKLAKDDAPQVAEVKAEVPGTKVASLDATMPMTVKESSSSTPTSKQWRAAVRIGADNTRIEEKEQYLGTGLDVAYLPKLNPYLRLEIGAVADLYSQNNRNRLTAYHFAPMLGYQNNGFVAGVRGLAGVVSSNETKEKYEDFGADLRLGIEGDTWSAFVGGGRTENLERVGFDVGMKF
jgi:hypothetical protein